MKRTLALLLALTMLFALAACGKQAEPAAEPTPAPTPGGGRGLAGTAWEQGRMQGRFFTVNFNSGAGGLGVTGWFSTEGGLRSQVSFLVQRLCI